MCENPRNFIDVSCGFGVYRVVPAFRVFSPIGAHVHSLVATVPRLGRIVPILSTSSPQEGDGRQR